MKDVLFLLSAGFRDGEGAPYYCPYCTVFEGLLHLYPQLTSELEVRRVAFAKPRAEIVALLGNDYQSCPALVAHRPLAELAGRLPFKKFGDLQFLDEPEDIGNYLSLAYGIPRPH